MKLIWSMNAQRESKGYRKAGAEVVWYGKKGDDIVMDVLNAWRKAGWIIRIEPDLPVKKKPEREIAVDSVDIVDTVDTVDTVDSVDTVDNKAAQVADTLAVEADLVEAVCEIEQEAPKPAAPEQDKAGCDTAPLPAVDLVNEPPHYLAGGIETIDYIEAKGFNYNLGNVCKYISRAGHKGDTIEDLKKAAWYLNREISLLEKEAGEHACV